MLIVVILQFINVKSVSRSFFNKLKSEMKQFQFKTIFSPLGYFDNYVHHSKR